MRSLFIKIFLWFWLAMVVIIASTVVLMSLIEPHRPFREDGRHIKMLSREGRRAIEILERSGPGPLRDFLHGGRPRPGRSLYLFNEKGEPVMGEQVPHEARRLASRVHESGMTEFSDRGRRPMLARPLYGTEGRPYVIVSELPGRHRQSHLWRFLNPRFLSMRLLVIFIVASIFCSWLAWYLTSPVRRLRKAAQQIASGDLKTRVGGDLGRRRDELADLARDFDLMAERIEALITSQGRLLRDVSHELRSPLARLHVALELARQRSGNEAREALDRIEQEAERLNTLIGQLRTLTLLESGAESIAQKPLDLSALVRAISDDADFEARNRNCSVRATLEDNIGVYGSEELLRRAIENIVRNAIRYTSEGTEVEVFLKQQERRGKKHAVLKVRDHGPGVPEESLSRLFSPFYRVAESRDRQSGGMGIGLAITDLSVRLHNGSVEARNDPDGGLSVNIEIPLSLEKDSALE